MVAWHEVPGTRSEMGPSRRDGLRAVFVTVFTRRLLFAYLAVLKSGVVYPPGTFNHTVPYGTDPFNRRFQALRARLPPFSPSGTAPLRFNFSQNLVCLRFRSSPSHANPHNVSSQVPVASAGVSLETQRA
jgi:hypothetical protein